VISCSGALVDLWRISTILINTLLLSPSTTGGHFSPFVRRSSSNSSKAPSLVPDKIKLLRGDGLALCRLKSARRFRICQLSNLHISSSIVTSIKELLPNLHLDPVFQNTTTICVRYRPPESKFPLRVQAILLLIAMAMETPPCCLRRSYLDEDGMRA